MWKWLRVVSLVLLLWLIPVGVLADTSQEVTVTAMGYICAIPGGFTLTYINDYEVGISWIKGDGAENTMIRAAYGRVPESRTDGYLVYYGDGTMASDTGVNFEEGVSDVYYRAWSQNAGGVWEEVGISDLMENPYMLLAVLSGLALALFIATFALKSGRRILAFASAGAWMLLGVYSYTKFVAVWDIYYSLFWLSMGLVLVCVLIPVILREKTEDDLSPEVDEYGDYDEGNDPFLGKRKKRARRHFPLG